MAGLTGWFGGKNAMSDWIYSFIPKDITKYVEPFSGSFPIFFNEDFSHVNDIIYNDANKLQVNFMICCKDHQRMASELKKSLNDGYLKCELSEIADIKKHYRNLYTHIKNPKENDFYDNMDFNFPNYEKAVIYAFMITSAFNACHARGAGFSGFANNRLKLQTLLNKLDKPLYQEKLSQITDILNIDFEECINKYDSEDSFFYCDPPYKQTDGIGTHNQDYGSHDTFGEDSHLRLSNLLKQTKGRWALSYYYFKELEEWFPKDKYIWESKEFFRSSASFSESKNTKGNELLILNYNPLTGERV